MVQPQRMALRFFNIERTVIDRIHIKLSTSFRQRICETECLHSLRFINLSQAFIASMSHFYKVKRYQPRYVNTGSFGTQTVCWTTTPLPYLWELKPLYITMYLNLWSSKYETECCQLGENELCHYRGAKTLLVNKKIIAALFSLTESATSYNIPLVCLE